MPALLRSVVEAEPSARVDHVHLMDLAPSGFLFELIWWCKTPKWAEFADTQQRIQLAITTRLTAEGVALAYPTQSIQLTEKRPLEPDATRPA